MQGVTVKRMLLMSVSLAAAVATSVVGMQNTASAEGQAGTTLTASKTATGYCETRNAYDWSLDKSADPLSIEVSRGNSATISYNLEATRSLATSTTVCGVRGEITVTNGGDRPTQGLKLVDNIQTKLGAGQFENYVSNVVDVSSNPVLDAGETGVYPYDFEFTPVDGVTYRNRVDVTITNHSGQLDEPFGPSPAADFSLPAEPTVVETDGGASVADALTCPTGFTCTASEAGPWSLSGARTVTYTVTVANTSAMCDSYYSVANTATLTEGDSGATSSDSATVSVYTGTCPTGVTRTIGYWKTHAGFTGNNADRVTQYLPIWLGTPSGAKSVQVTTASQAVTILSSMGSNGIDKLKAQLLAAKLNIAAGANGSSVSSVIANSDAFLATYASSSWSSLKKADQTKVLGWMTALDTFNNSGES